MNKINFKKGRYILPLIVLPFLFIFNYLYLDTFGPAGESAPEAGAAVMVETASLNTELPDANLKKREVKDKFEASREAHKYRTDYSAIRELGDNSTKQQEYGSVYSAEEQAILDSLNSQILANRQPEPFMERVGQRQERIPLPGERHAKQNPTMRRKCACSGSRWLTWILCPEQERSRQTNQLAEGQQLHH